MIYNRSNGYNLTSEMSGIKFYNIEGKKLSSIPKKYAIKSN